VHGTFFSCEKVVVIIGKQSLREVNFVVHLQSVGIIRFLRFHNNTS
jgi:hypothetical protein